MRNTIEMLFGTGAKHGTALEWVKVGTTAAEGGYDTYFDPATIRKSGSRVKMWHLHDFKTPQVARDIAYLSSKNWVEYDTQSNQRRTLYFSWSAEPMGAGKSVYRNDQPSEWRSVVAGSMADVLMKVARDNPSA